MSREIHNEIYQAMKKVDDNIPMYTNIRKTAPTQRIGTQIIKRLRSRGIETEPDLLDASISSIFPHSYPTKSRRALEQYIEQIKQD